MWWIYALLSALFAALTAVLAKVGIKEVNTDLATAIRTVVILVVGADLESPLGRDSDHWWYNGVESLTEQR